MQGDPRPSFFLSFYFLKNLKFGINNHSFLVLMFTKVILIKQEFSHSDTCSPTSELEILFFKLGVFGIFAGNTQVSSHHC